MARVHQPELIPRSTDAKLASIATDRLKDARDRRDAVERELEDCYATHDREVWHAGESIARHCESEKLGEIAKLDAEILRLERTIRGLRR